MKIDRLDHLVLTVADVEKTCAFYAQVMGMDVVTFGNGRKALTFGQQKINLHQKGSEIDPKAISPTPGSGDLCFISVTPLTEIVAQLRRLNVPIEIGPAPRTGALGAITSVYFRDPDGNLLEVSTYD